MEKFLANLKQAKDFLVGYITEDAFWVGVAVGIFTQILIAVF